jgi:conjugal transfer/entry exclusion protein
MVIIESFKEDINNSLKLIQENTDTQVKELNKMIQDLKVEIETIKKIQMEANLEMENLGKGSGVTNRIQQIQERISGVEDTVEEIDTTVKENSKQKFPYPKYPRNSRHNEKTKSKNKQNRGKQRLPAQRT